MHHVIVFEGDEEKKKARRWNAPNFDNDSAMNLRDAGVLVDGMVAFTAVAAASDGSVIPTAFTFELDDPILGTVDDNGMGTAIITGVRKGPTKLIIKSAERGIKVEIPLSIHNEVKGIVITPPTVDVVAKGTEVALTATAYDEASGDDKTTNSGDTVPGVTFSWSSSNPSVATVDTEDSNMSPTIKTHGAGKAKIQARIGDVKSNEVTVEVYEIEEPTRRIVVSTANHPLTVTATVDTATAVVADRVIQFTAGSAITVRVQQVGIQLDGDIGYINVADGVTVTFTSLNKDILDLAADDDSNTATTSTGDATYTIIDADLGDMIPKMEGEHNVTVRISSPFAGAKHVTVKVTVTGRT